MAETSTTISDLKRLHSVLAHIDEHLDIMALYEVSRFPGHEPIVTPLHASVKESIVKVSSLVADAAGRQVLEEDDGEESQSGSESLDSGVASDTENG